MTHRSPRETAHNQLSTALDRVAPIVGKWFEIDLRALAAFRVSLGLLILADLATRARNIGAFYTDAGVLPRQALFSDYSPVYSLHAISGAAWAQTLLFLVAGAFALALIVGYRTRVATVVSWLLLLSLHARNPMVLNSGDVLLRMLLFWGIFLPLDERWSLFAADRTDDTDRSTVASIATIALLLQVVLMYATNTIHKFNGEFWMDGEALVYILSADQFTVHLGNVIAEYHTLLELFNYLWMGLILASPLLFVLTGAWRAVLPTMFVGMHLGMIVTMRIGLFPLVVVAALLPFYPPVVWDAVSKAAERIGLSEVLRTGQNKLTRIAAAAPSFRTPSVPNPAGVINHSRTAFFTVVPYLLLALVIMSNAQAVDYAEVPDPGEEVLDTVQAEQSWRMFAPDPARTTRWFAAPATLENESRVDVLHRSQVDLERPEDVETTYPTARWRKYLSNVYSADNENHRSYLANYLCDRWNRNHETDAKSVTIYQMYERYDPYAEEMEADGIVKVITYSCSGEFVQND
ncbi:Vitamin K-dependent gamma-carboxylase [Natronoarchaeum philippinense]|uniref:Vitamin K-dependent gamma-carboxylase n=1 Tax=Natronoarchaeum philippinense TaxID=558529 RepID=A0A285N7Q4_NATPI|nr:HTTM domain-containing protein [Natronoarchaeum philippinense]SNZ05512.1 Vitamin K-dependent gamma-carboxylase [Natronoarchaeum philippinense]